MKKFVVLSVIILAGAGCTQTVETPTSAVDSASTQSIVSELTTNVFDPRVDLPMENYVEGRTYKTFGEYIEDRFTGYHVGDDVEVSELEAEYPVHAIADGIVTHAGSVSGYGGVMVINHDVDGEQVSAIYGHVDLDSSIVSTGDVVTRGQFLANLGDHNSAETDGERKHLHFALYEGEDVRLSGYETSEANVENWINPTEFFARNGVDVTNSGRTYDMWNELGGNNYHLEFEIPAGWEVEYVPEIESLNLFVINGEGTARERSQIFIRYFDSSSFQTLSSVAIYETEDLTIGTDDYVARRYDIEKNPGFPDFTDQPSWRNERHIVTDVRFEDGFTRYYVIAANPELDSAVYEEFLDSLTVYGITVQ